MRALRHRTPAAATLAGYAILTATRYTDCQYKPGLGADLVTNGAFGDRLFGPRPLAAFAYLIVFDGLLASSDFERSFASVRQRTKCGAPSRQRYVGSP